MRKTRSVVSRIGKFHIGADVEDTNVQRGVLVRVAQEGHDLGFLSCVQWSPEHLAARRLDFPNERRKLLALAASDKDGETFGREFLGNLAADEISGTDNGHGRVSLFQGLSPEQEGNERSEFEGPRVGACPFIVTSLAATSPTTAYAFEY